MRYSSLLKIALLLLSVSSITPWCSLPIGNTFLWWCLQGLMLFLFFRIFHLSKNKLDRKPLLIFLLYVFASSIYGFFFQTENYWDYKFLISNLMVFTLPIASYVVNDRKHFAQSIRFWIRYSWVLLLLLAPFLASDAFGRFLVPYTFLALMMRICDKKTILAIFAAYLVTIIFGYESRSDIIKFTATICLGLASLVPFLIRKIKILSKLACVTFFISPIIFFILAVTGTFNIFELENEADIKDKYMMTSSGYDSGEVSALADTRTFLYVEEITSAINHNYYIFGRSPARGYESNFFGAAIDADLHTNRNERVSCEVSMLNIFNYFGIVGLAIYAIIFLIASYKAIWKSRNIYIKIIGVYIAFRWMFGFIEDFSRFDLNMTFLWLMIGMCYSQKYRNFNNRQFRLWFSQILAPKGISKINHKQHTKKRTQQQIICEQIKSGKAE